MRIGIDATALPPQPVGAGTYIVNLIRTFAQLDHGHQFVVYAQQHGKEIIAVPEQPGIEWVTLPDRSPAYRLIWEQTFFPILVKRKQVDLLHSLHYTRPLFLPCASVVTFHDMTFFLYPQLHTRSKRLFFPPAIRLSARLADAMITISENTRLDAIRLLNIPPDKIYGIPLAANESYRLITDQHLLESARPKYHLPQEFMLYVGIVEPRKNVPMLLRCYHELLRQGTAIPLVIVGRFGWMYEEVLRLVDELGLKDKVLFTGYVPSQDLPLIYNLAQVFVYPSIYEGFGLPPLEAMACGVPVITTAVSSMPEHVGEAGLLIPPQDEKALVEAMQKVLSDGTLRAQMSQKGRAQAAKFSWKRVAQETLQVYQRVLLNRSK